METNKRKTKQKNTINLLIASPADARDARKFLLDSLETKFRKEHYEKACGCRLIVHGWEDLASQEGNPQDIINNQLIKKVDFVATIFKHTKGNPVIDSLTGRIRSESGTIEELNLTLDKTNKDHPLGILYYYFQAPQVILDDPHMKKNLRVGMN